MHGGIKQLHIEKDRVFSGVIRNGSSPVPGTREPGLSARASAIQLTPPPLQHFTHLLAADSPILLTQSFLCGRVFAAVEAMLICSEGD
jgi:hypothetical protein